jgi:cold shock CspA family protein
MPFYGKIASFESEMNAGMITSLQSGHAVMFFGGDLQHGGTPVEKLIGRRVSFDLVQTGKGNMAVNVKVDSASIVRPGDRLATLVTPVLVGATGYYFYEYLGLTLLLSYLAAVNLVGFLLLICHSSRGPTIKTTYSELLLGALAIGGAAISIFVGSALVPCKWRTEAGRFALFALIVVHLISIRAVEPGLVSKNFSSYLYRSSTSYDYGSSTLPDLH